MNYKLANTDTRVLRHPIVYIPMHEQNQSFIPYNYIFLKLKSHQMQIEFDERHFPQSGQHLLYSTLDTSLMYMRDDRKPC